MACRLGRQHLHKYSSVQFSSVQCNAVCCAVTCVVRYSALSAVQCSAPSGHYMDQKECYGDPHQPFQGHPSLGSQFSTIDDLQCRFYTHIARPQLLLQPGRRLDRHGEEPQDRLVLQPPELPPRSAPLTAPQPQTLPGNTITKH